MPCTHVKKLLVSAVTTFPVLLRYLKTSPPSVPGCCFGGTCTVLIGSNLYQRTRNPLKDWPSSRKNSLGRPFGTKEIREIVHEIYSNFPLWVYYPSTNTVILSMLNSSFVPPLFLGTYTGN